MQVILDGADGLVLVIKLDQGETGAFEEADSGKALGDVFQADGMGCGGVGGSLVWIQFDGLLEEGFGEGLGFRGGAEGAGGVGEECSELLDGKYSKNLG